MHREMPFPVSDREVVICSTSLVVEERKGAMVIIRSANAEREKHWQLKVAPEDGKLVRAEMVKGFMYVEEIDEQSCWFHGYINVNPKLALIPDWFLNFMVKRVVYKVMSKLQGKDAFEGNEKLQKKI